MFIQANWHTKMMTLRIQIYKRRYSCQSLSLIITSLLMNAINSSKAVLIHCSQHDHSLLLITANLRFRRHHNNSLMNICRLQTLNSFRMNFLSIHRVRTSYFFIHEPQLLMQYCYCYRWRQHLFHICFCEPTKGYTIIRYSRAQLMAMMLFFL